MKKLLIIPILLLSILCNAQFTKGGGVFLKTGSGFMAAPAEDATTTQVWTVTVTVDSAPATSGTVVSGDDWVVYNGVIVKI